MAFLTPATAPAALVADYLGALLRIAGWLLVSYWVLWAGSSLFLIAEALCVHPPRPTGRLFGSDPWDLRFILMQTALGELGSIFVLVGRRLAVGAITLERRRRAGRREVRELGHAARRVASSPDRTTQPLEPHAHPDKTGAEERR